MAHRYSMEVKGHADFSGYWRVAKLENFDAFLQDLGFPWVVRKVRPCWLLTRGAVGHS